MKSNKIKLISGKWNDDFSAARNEANKYATSDWILTMDADEKINFKYNIFQKLLSFLSKFSDLENVVFNMELCGESSSFKSGRLIKNREVFYYKGKVHETYVNSKTNFAYNHINLKLKIKYEIRQSNNKIRYYNNLLLDTMREYPKEQRWGFLYLRDNFKRLHLREFESIDEYTHGLLIIILNKYLNCGELSKFSFYLCIAKEFFNSLDLVYLEYFYYETKIKQDQKELLNKFLVQYDRIPSNGELFDESHIDNILALLLLNNGYISESKGILEELFLKNPNLPCFKDNYVQELLSTSKEKEAY